MITKQDVRDAKCMRCSKCGSPFFREVGVVKMVVDPMDISTKQHINLSVPICDKCGTIAEFVKNDPEISGLISDILDDEENEKQMIVDYEEIPKDPNSKLIL